MSATAAGGVVGVVHPNDLGLAGDVFGNRAEVGEPAVLLLQRQPVRLAAGEHRPNGVDRVGGIGHEGDIAGVDQAEGHVADALFRADQGQHFRVAVEGDAEPLAVPVGDGLAQLGKALRLRVAVVGRLVRRRVQGVEDALRGGQVGVADGEGDDVDALGALLVDLLADLDEEVRRKLFDAVGELH